LFVFNQFGDLERCALRPGNVHSADGWEDVLRPVVARYQSQSAPIQFRGDAAFALPGMYEFLETQGIEYAIRLPANQVLQARISHLLKRPVGRPPHEVRRTYASFRYKAGSWTQPRRVIAKVEWHLGELFPRVGFIITNMNRSSKNVVKFYNKRGTAEQWIKEGKGAIKWTRLSCRSRQLPTHAGDPRADQGVVAHEPVRKADQDRCEGRQPWPLCHVSDGRSSHPAAVIRGNYAADRRVTVASGDSSNMRSRDERSFGLKTTGEVRDNEPSASLFIVQRPDWLPITRQCSTSGPRAEPENGGHRGFRIVYPGSYRESRLSA
jgi:hypothetical protein